MRFRLDPHQIKPIVIGYGSCLASNRITVDGAPVGYCYRENSDNEYDSGWRFLAGDESDGYTENPDNFAIFDVNTIVNYSPSLTKVITAAVGSAFLLSTDGTFAPVAFDEP